MSLIIQLNQHLSKIVSTKTEHGHVNEGGIIAGLN